MSMKKIDDVPPILYRLAPHDPAGHRYRITLTIDAPSPAGQRLSLPAWIPGSYLIRDGGWDGADITMLGLDPHGANDGDHLATFESEYGHGALSNNQGFLNRGGRMLNEETYENLWDVLSEVPSPWNPAHTHPPGGLPEYFRENVIGGPDAFHLVVEDFRSFGEAVVKKLVTEIAGATGRASMQAASASR